MPSPTAVRAFVTFEADGFDKSPKPGTINPCCRCEDVARWLFGALRALPGLSATEPDQEDFGWVIEVVPTAGTPDARAPYFFMVNVQTFDEDDRPPDEQYGVYVAVVRRGGLLKKLFGGAKSAQSDSSHLAGEIVVLNAIDAALRSRPGVRKIQWWEEGFAVDTPSDHPAD